MMRFRFLLRTVIPLSLIVTVTSLVIAVSWETRTVASGSVQLADKEIAFETVDKITVTFRPGLMKRSQNGDVYSFSIRPFQLARVSALDGAVTHFRLGDIKEVRDATSFQFIQDLTLGPSGLVYVPAVWRYQTATSRATHFGVFVFDGQGNYTRKIVFTPPAEVRRLVADATGYLFVIGIDSAYFRKGTPDCLLLHKFSPDGQRLASASPCPNSRNLLTGSHRPGPALEQLKFDVDLAHIWMSDGQIKQILPFSHLLRTFETDLRMLREIRIQVPFREDDRAMIRIAQVLPVSNGNLLLVWNYSTRSGDLGRNVQYSSLHDSEGALLTKASPVSSNIPLFSDDNGFAYLAKLIGKNTVELVRSRVTFR
jgi:hypothetical protein